MRYENFISEEVLDRLKILVGTKIEALYSDRFSIRKEIVESQLFILRLTNKSVLTFKNAAKETAQDNDYYKFLIESVVVTDDNYDGKTLGQKYSKIGLNSERLVRIEIYNRHEVFGDEEFDYDVVILFICKNHFRFIIALEERFDEQVIYSSSKRVIDAYLTGLNLRNAFPTTNRI
ncbi:hypothetical protein ACFQZI_14940 [Mucilaginibacter lutimaris]|uniref:Uncharacterized protein n=1 Tax=Mucilaginibacter lutimaris TaxID=931629 RepID=A0ABW2ZIW3_9SPHI